MIIDIDKEKISSMDMAYAKDLAFKCHANFDDIHNAGTKGFWKTLPEETKQDLTEVGHMTGTGIIDFN